MKDALMAVAALTYNFSLVAGTAYLVQVYKWSPLWFLLAVGLMVLKINDGDKKETDEKDVKPV
jgi:hypothetical protein